MIRLQAVPLTEAAFHPFGTVIAVPSDGARTLPVPVIDDTRSSAKVTATLIDLMPAQAPRIVRAIERHMHSAQFFLNLSQGAVSIVVFPSRDDGQPDLAGARAFIAASGQAFGYHAGTWHAGVTALGMPAKVASLLSRDGTSLDVEEQALSEAIEVDWT